MIVLRRRANVIGSWEYYTGRDYHIWTVYISQAKQYASETDAANDKRLVGGLVHTEENHNG